MTGMMGRFREEIGENFCHQLSIQREDFQHKLDTGRRRAADLG
jgi:hypothetical protein